jgi:hypothetical protein
MQFRRSGQRDERRRRVMIEERIADTESGDDSTSRAPAASADDAAASPARRYTHEALADRQPRITDLLPKRPWTLTVLVLAGLTLVAGVLALAGGCRTWAAAISRNDLSAFDLAVRGNVAAWLSSLLLTLAAAGSVFIFALRRHKVDDYRGRYRLWLWAAAALLLGSIDATSHLHNIARGLLVALTGTTLYGDGAIWWMIVYAVGFGALAVRLLIEMWQCRASAVAWASAAACYAIAAAVSLNLVLANVEVLNVLVKSAATMLGHLGLLFTVVFYARHVHLDAQGQLPVRAERKKREKTRRTASPSPPPSSAEEEPAEEATRPIKRRERGTVTRVDAAHEPNTTPRKRTDLETAPAADERDAEDDAAESDDESDDHDGEQLSRSERRRLRKKMRRDQRQSS